MKMKIVSQLGTLQKTLVFGLANTKDEESLFTSKYSSSYGGDGCAALRKHFDVLWDAISRVGTLEVTAKVYTKRLITTEVQETIFSENGTGERRKAHLLQSAIQEWIETDQSAVGTLSDAERNYSQIEREALSVILVSKSFISFCMDRHSHSWQITSLLSPYSVLRKEFQPW